MHSKRAKNALAPTAVSTLDWFCDADTAMTKTALAIIFTVVCWAGAFAEIREASSTFRPDRSLLLAM